MNIKPSWYDKPKMAGQTYAKENIDMLTTVIKKYGKTPAQKTLIENSLCALQANKEKMNYWLMDLTKKHIGLLRYALRRIDKMPANQLLQEVNNRHAMWKSDLLRSLELRAFELDKENYFKEYYLTRRFYGITLEDAKDRFEKYGSGLKEKYNYKIA